MKVTNLIFNSKNIKKFNNCTNTKYRTDLFMNIIIFVCFILIVGIFLLYRYNSKLHKIKIEDNTIIENSDININMVDIKKNQTNNNQTNNDINNVTFDEDKYYFL